MLQFLSHYSATSLQDQADRQSMQVGRYILLDLNVMIRWGLLRPVTATGTRLFSFLSEHLIY